MRTRNWSIRSKIIALVAVPLTALLLLWGFATALTAGPALDLLSARTLLDTVGTPGKALLAELQLERRLSVEFISAGRGNAAALITQRAATDRVTAEVRRTVGSEEALDAASDPLRVQIRQILADLDGLPANRLHVDRREVDAVGTQNLYNSIIDTGFRMFSATTFGEERIDRQIRALITIGRSQEYLSRVDSLLAGAFAAGKFTEAVRAELLQEIGTTRFLVAQGITDLPESARVAYQRLSTGASYNRLRELQDNLVSESRSEAASPVSAASWQPAYDTSIQQWREYETIAAESMADETTPVALAVLIRLGLAGLLGLAAIVISILVSVRVGRSIVGRLVRLRGEAREMAGERLPAVVRRLQRGEAVDVEVETPPLEYGRDEIGQLGYAFNEVQRTAVQSAVEEANVRRGINEVFLNIARRSQTLLHRQLALLDRMERRETEPQELEDLYRVDHLATRMRRHAEDLVILAGAAPGRGWRNPVPVIDVVRGAISEVEDYKRVDIVSVESTAVLGRAVGDVIHLIAELLENAASFSPPQTRVQVVGQILPNGYALEIEDRGLGMSPEAIADANRRLLEPPDFDPADSARLGLFVVAQLAHRHSIRVSLRPSAYGGVTAIVLIPGDLVTPGQGLTELSAGPSPSDKAWDRPLVGTGTEDPSRRSLAALQWQGTEELRSIPVPGRPVTINGTATAGRELTGPEPAGRELARPEPAGPELAGPELAGPELAGPAVAGPGSASPELVGRALAGPELAGPEFAGPELADPGLINPVGNAATAPQVGAGGPTPSAVVDGLTQDGLVQRRRTKPRRARNQPAAPPTLLPPNLTSPTDLTAIELPSAGDGLTSNGIGPGATGLTSPGLTTPGSTSSGPPIPGLPDPLLANSGLANSGLANSGLANSGLANSGLANSGLANSGLANSGLAHPDVVSPGRNGNRPATLPVPGGIPASPRPVDPPRIPSPRVAPESVPPLADPGAMPDAGPAPEPARDDTARDEPVLPRRVRQASLAPQLRGPVAERADASASRSPEQVRSLMSALQQGTTRGRLEAAGLSAAKAAAEDADPPAADGTELSVNIKRETVGEPTWSEAATVTFPAVQSPAPAGDDRTTDNAPEAHHENRPEKDA